MDTLSTPSLTTFQVPKTSKLNHQSHLKPPISHPTTTAKTTATSSSFSTLQQKDTFTPQNSYHSKKSSSTFLPPLSTNSTPPRAYVHHRASSGYAAALLDISQCNGTILKVERDVKRLLKVLTKFMMNDLEENAKGRVVKEFLDKGKFEKSFVGLVKLVIDKGNKVETVKEVLEEFVRVFSQLSTSPPTRLAMGNSS